MNLYTVIGWDNNAGEKRLVHIVAVDEQSAENGSIELLSEDFSPILVLQGAFDFSLDNDGETTMGLRVVKVNGTHDPVLQENLE